MFISVSIGLSVRSIQTIPVVVFLHPVTRGIFDNIMLYCKYMFTLIPSLYEGLDGGSRYSLIITNLAIYSLSLKFWLIH